MRAVFRRELHAFFTGITAPLFLCVALMLTGIYTAVLCFSEGYGNFEIILSNLSYILLVLLPLLSMRLFASEARAGTDRLLHALPLRPTQIVLGKYLAAVCVYGIYCALLCAYPALLSAYGTVNIRTAYSSIAGFFLLGCALLALGCFCSSLTENPAVAAVATFAAGFLSYILPTVSDYLAASGMAAFVLFTFAIAGLAVLIYVLTHRAVPAIGAGFALEIPLAAVLLLDASLLDGAVQRVLGACALFSRLDPFTYGVFDWTAVVYYIGVCFLFVLLCVLRFERTARFGGYRTGLVVLACGCVLAANVLVTALPASVTNIDTTGSGVFTLSDEGRSFLEALDTPVTVWRIAEIGEEDEGLTELFEQCRACTSYITFADRDPVLYPYFTSSYTSDALESNSLIVTGPERTEIVDFRAVYLTDSSGTGYFDGESALISAVRNVTTESLPVLYTLTGHGETEPDESLRQTLEGRGFDIRSLSLPARDSVPEDAALVLILSPAADLTVSETEKLEAYLERGGRLLLCTDLLAVSTPNLEALAEYAGLKIVPGLVVEGDSDYHLQDYPAYLLPTLGTHEISSALREAGYRALMPVAHALTTAADAPEGWTYSSLLRTSDAAYRKEDVLSITTFDRETGDEQGACDVALAAEHEGTGARIVWYGSSMLLNSTVDEAVSGANSALFVNSALWLSAQDTEMGILPRSLAADTILMSEQDASLWNAVCVYAVPLGILLCGLAVWGRRRGKPGKGARRT